MSLPLVNPFGPPHQQALSQLNENDLHRSNNNNASSTLSPGYQNNEDHSILAFVSGIPGYVGDDRMLKILGNCGDIVSWDRGRDANDEVLSFGFCEFENITSAACAFRVFSSTGGLKQGGWVLPGSHNNQQQHHRLNITVDLSTRSLISDYIAGTDSTQPVKEAFDAVEQAIKRLEEESSSKYAVTPSTELQQNLSPSKQNIDDIDKPFSVKAEDEWELERAREKRYSRYVLDARKREEQIEKDQDERERLVEQNSLRELERAEERQRTRDAMALVLSRWDDTKEESMRNHEYYRDRERWWHYRKIARAKEMEHEEETERSCKQTQKTGHGIATNSEMPPADGVLDTEQVFSQPVEWKHVDEDFIQNMILPEVRQQFQKYFEGEADDDSSAVELVEFVLDHIRHHKPPQDLVEGLEMVLVEEAAPFVTRIWRILH